MFSKIKSNKFISNYKITQTLHLKLLKILEEPKFPIVICHGPAGTGKTTLICEHAIKSLKEDAYKKIIITRPVISTDEAIGFLPGDLNEKMNPWLLPIFDIFYEYYPRNSVNEMVKNGVIEIAPFAFMRGRSFKNSFIIADEMQNSTPAQMKMLLTRLGDNSKIAITGDLEQQDLLSKINGLADLLNLLNIKYENKHEIYNNGYGLIEFNKNLVVRHEMVKKVLELYEN